MEELNITHDNFIQLANSISDKLLPKKNLFQGIICPLRGGFYLSYYVSNKLGLPLHYMEISSYVNRSQGKFNLGLVPALIPGAHYLICDDILDSGRTVDKIKEIYPENSFTIAVLVNKKEIPDLYSGISVKHDIWVNFFWEDVKP